MRQLIRLREKLADARRKLQGLRKLEHALRLALRSCKIGAVPARKAACGSLSASIALESRWV